MINNTILQGFCFSTSDDSYALLAAEKNVRLKKVSLTNFEKPSLFLKPINFKNL